MMETWTDDLSVENAVIDNDHKKLIRLVGGVEAMIKARNSTDLPQELDRLQHLLYVHFVSEEKIAQAVNFPFASNKVEHQYVLKEFQHMKKELITKNGVWSDGAAEHYSRFLNRWITDHVLKEDMQLRLVLKNYPYDFSP